MSRSFRVDTFFYAWPSFNFLGALRVGTSIDRRLFDFFDFILGGTCVENRAETFKKFFEGIKHKVDDFFYYHDSILNKARLFKVGRIQF